MEIGERVEHHECRPLAGDPFLEVVEESGIAEDTGFGAGSYSSGSTSSATAVDPLENTVRNGRDTTRQRRTTSAFLPSNWMTSPTSTTPPRARRWRGTLLEQPDLHALPPRPQ